MASRPTVSVFNSSNALEVSENIPLPAVFTSPIRLDVVQFVHDNLARNRRQAHGVFWLAGHESSSEAWGTGRAVARIPRVGGSGTHRSGQGAFGNMCRGGHMFAPLKVWRRWHRKVNLEQRRHAVGSALAASAVPALVMARGHKIEQVPEIPLVVDSIHASKTKELLKLLSTFGASEDVVRARDSKKVRSGKGKMRNKRYVLRKGPLIVYSDESQDVKRAARNIPGVETVNVSRLSLFKLAPGGHLGRFIIWTKDAFKSLNSHFGTFKSAATEKKGYTLERPLLHNADLASIINSDAVQSVVRPARKNQVRHDVSKRNPLKNRGQLRILNPFADSLKRQQTTAQEARTKKIQELRAAKKPVTDKAVRKQKRAHNKVVRAKTNALFSELHDAQERAERELIEEMKNEEHAVEEEGAVDEEEN